jgi:hypothetical protein
MQYLDDSVTASVVGGATIFTLQIAYESQEWSRPGLRCRSELTNWTASHTQITSMRVGAVTHVLRE